MKYYENIPQAHEIMAWNQENTCMMYGCSTTLVRGNGDFTRPAASWNSHTHPPHEMLRHSCYNSCMNCMVGKMHELTGSASALISAKQNVFHIIAKDHGNIFCASNRLLSLKIEYWDHILTFVSHNVILCAYCDIHSAAVFDQIMTKLGFCWFH